MGVSLPSAGGGKRRLDAELNVVPFIDLLSMCICFLLMTAIWIEINSLQIKQVLGTEATELSGKAIDIQVFYKSPKKMEVSIEKNGQVVSRQMIKDVDQKKAENRLANYLSTILGATLTGQANTTARIVPAKSVSYGQVVSTLDLFKSYGVNNLAIVPVRSR